MVVTEEDNKGVDRTEIAIETQSNAENSFHTEQRNGLLNIFKKFNS